MGGMAQAVNNVGILCTHYCRIAMPFLHALSLQLSATHLVKMGSVIDLITVTVNLVGQERAAGNVILKMNLSLQNII